VTRGKFRNEYQQILGATVQNLVAWANWRTGFVDSWNEPLLHILHVSGKLKKRMFIESRLCVSPVQLPQHSTDFHETWHESYDITGHADAVYFCPTISNSVTA
jgi:hypothetical protein